MSTARLTPICRSVLLGVLMLSAVLPAGCIRIPVREGGPIEKLIPAKKPEPEKSVPSVATPAMTGTWLSAGSWKVTVAKAVPASRGPNGERPASGKEFLAVEVEFKNVRSDETLYVNPKDVSLTDHSGKKLTTDTSNPGYNARGMSGITPGMGGTAVFVYQIPKGTSGYVFTFAPKARGKRVKMEWGIP